MNDIAQRRLRLKEAHNNIYNTDEILETLKCFEGRDTYSGALAYVCLLLSIRPEDVWGMFEYVG